MGPAYTRAGALACVVVPLATMSGAKKKAVPLSWNGLLAKSSGEEGKLFTSKAEPDCHWRLAAAELRR